MFTYKPEIIVRNEFYQALKGVDSFTILDLTQSYLRQFNVPVNRQTAKAYVARKVRLLVENNLLTISHKGKFGRFIYQKVNDMHESIWILKYADGSSTKLTRTDKLPFWMRDKSTELDLEMLLLECENTFQDREKELIAYEGLCAQNPAISSTLSLFKSEHDKKLATLSTEINALKAAIEYVKKNNGHC